MYKELQGLCTDIMAQHEGVEVLAMPTEIKSVGFKSGNGLLTFATPQLRSAMLMAWSRNRIKTAKGCNVVLKLDSPPKQRVLNSQLWTIGQQLRHLLQVGPDILESNYGQGKIWLNHSGNIDGGAIIMVRSRTDGALFYVVTCAWTTTEAARVLADLRLSTALLADCKLSFVSKQELEVISRKEAAQTQP